MHLRLALLLSSQRQAEGFLMHSGIGMSHQRYRLCVEHQPLKDYTLSIFHATYPDKAEGKGWGEPIYSAEPHHIEHFPDVHALIDFLSATTLSVDDGWEPVESEE